MGEKKGASTFLGASQNRQRQPCTMVVPSWMGRQGRGMTFLLQRPRVSSKEWHVSVYNLLELAEGTAFLCN